MTEKPTGSDLKYAALASALRRSIVAGTYAVGSKLPTEKELIDSTGLSLTTVRRALQSLVDEGLITRQRGSGSFVAPWVAKPERSEFVIGVMVPETRLYYDQVIKGIQDHLSVTRSGSALLATYDWDTERESQALKLLMDAHVDGLILTPTLPRGPSAREVLAELGRLPVPIVLAERSAAWAGPRGRMEHVVTDHRGGAFDAVVHLQGLGRQRVGLVYRDGTHTTAGIVEGYRLACHELGWIPWEAGLPQSSRRGYVAPADLGAVAQEVTDQQLDGLLVFGDREAIALQHELVRHGVEVPDTIAMVSYDDETADMATVPLTAVSPPKYQLGQKAAALILRRLRHGDASPPEQVQLRPVLVVRDSCGAKSTPDGSYRWSLNSTP